MAHLLVTNDFPPKIGGIQSLLWEWWRRLPPERTTVLTTPYAGARDFDERAPMRVVRTRQQVLLPTPALGRQILSLADEVGAGIVVLDPVLPVGLLGPWLARRGMPYAVILHGAEITVPGRLPASRQLLGRVLRGADHVISAGSYPLREAERAAGRPLPATVIPPGVDTERLRPAADAAERARLREALGLPREGPLVVSASRLVPRKGMDRLIDAAALLAPEHPGLVVAISGGGRDRRRLERRVAKVAQPAGADVRLLGRLDDADLASLYRCGDVFTMLCRNRWLGLEQEGFGIVFLEAAAAGVPQVAGRSGGAHEAVADGHTGVVVARPRDSRAVARTIAPLLTDEAHRLALGRAARERALGEFSYDLLAARLDAVLAPLESKRRP